MLSLWAPVVLYMAAIFLVSGDPAPPAPAALSDKLLHAMAYFGLSVLVFRAVGGGLSQRVAWRSALAALAITVGYGVFDEVHQMFVPNRSAELNDLYADIAGAILGLIACWAWGIIQSLIPTPQSRIRNPKSQR